LSAVDLKFGSAPEAAELVLANDAHHRRKQGKPHDFIERSGSFLSDEACTASQRANLQLKKMGSVSFFSILDGRCPHSPLDD
jgi:hypothetical protein